MAGGAVGQQGVGSQGIDSQGVGGAMRGLSGGPLYGPLGGSMSPGMASLTNQQPMQNQASLNQEQVDRIRLAMQNQPGDTFIPNNLNRPSVPFTQTLQGLGMGGGLPMQGGTGLGGVFGGGSMGAPNSQLYDSYIRELANSGQRSTLPITPGPIRSTPMPARPLPPRPGPQVQPIRRPLPMSQMGGLAGLAGMMQGRR